MVEMKSTAAKSPVCFDGCRDGKKFRSRKCLSDGMCDFIAGKASIPRRGLHQDPVSFFVGKEEELAS